MRPKIFIPLAVCALAFTGCASEASTAVPAPSASESVDPAAVVLATAPPDSVYDPETGEVMPMEEFEAKSNAEAEPTISEETVEENFAGFAETRAHAHGAANPNPDDVIAALHKFCADGTPIKVSDVQPLNDNLEITAESTYCDQLSN